MQPSSFPGPALIPYSTQTLHTKPVAGGWVRLLQVSTGLQQEQQRAPAEQEARMGSLLRRPNEASGPEVCHLQSTPVNSQPHKGTQMKICSGHMGGREGIPYSQPYRGKTSVCASGSTLAPSSVYIWSAGFRAYWTQKNELESAATS